MAHISVLYTGLKCHHPEAAAPPQNRVRVRVRVNVRRLRVFRVRVRVRVKVRNVLL